MLPTVIQGATPLFGATLVPDPDRLLDEVHASGVTAFDSGLVYADEGGTCDGRLGAWAAGRGGRAAAVEGKEGHNVSRGERCMNQGQPQWTVEQKSVG